MSLLCVKTCFFCCSNSIEISSTQIDKHNHNEAIKERIFRIAHYLKIPKGKINPEEKEGTLSKISICYDCEEFSKKLSELCSELDLIQLQINYNLKLLNERIKQTPAAPVTLSNWQKIVHQKCLSEVRKSSKINPQLSLKKCDANPEPDADQPEVDMIVEEGPTVLGSLTIKQENYHRHLSGFPSRTNGKYKACEFCGQLITTAHLSRHKRLHCKIGKRLKLPLRSLNTGNFTCEYCHQKFSSGGSKRRHLMLVHKLNLISKASQAHRTVRKQPKSAKKVITKKSVPLVQEKWTGGFRTKRQNYSRRPTEILPKIFKCEHCSIRFTTDGNRRRHLINKHKDKPISPHVRKNKAGKVKAIRSKKVKICKENAVSCEYCDMLITEHNLKRHQLFACKAKKKGRLSLSSSVTRGKEKEMNGISGTSVKAERGQLETEDELVDVGVPEELVDEEHVKVMEAAVEVPDEDPLQI